MGRTQIDDKYQNSQLLRILFLWLQGQRYSMRLTPFLHDYYLITSISLFHSCWSTPLGHDSTLSGSYQRVPSLHHQFSSSTHEADNDTQRDAEKSTRRVLLRNWLGLLAWPCQLHTNFSVFNSNGIKRSRWFGADNKAKTVLYFENLHAPKSTERFWLRF